MQLFCFINLLWELSIHLSPLTVAINAQYSPESNGLHYWKQKYSSRLPSYTKVNRCHLQILPTCLVLSQWSLPEVPDGCLYSDRGQSLYIVHLHGLSFVRIPKMSRWMLPCMIFIKKNKLVPDGVQESVS